MMLVVNPDQGLLDASKDNNILNASTVFFDFDEKS